MKKIFALATGSMAIVGSVHAQSGVTLYGIIDEGLNYNSNSGGEPTVQLHSRCSSK
jgi:predicted porin